MSSEHHAFRLGTSGWAHRDWIGKVYAPDLPPGEYLATYATQLNTVEIESTFFDVPPREMVRSWHQRTPHGFVFCPSMPRQITHRQRLRQCQGALDAFLERMNELGEKLGPILLQLPGDFRRDEQPYLEAFLQQLPRERQFAIEFHHGSWCKNTTLQLLESYQVAWVVVEAPFLPRLPQVSADFAYVRWHGHPSMQQRSQRQADPGAALQPWVPILRQLAQQTSTVYGYVRNSFSGDALRDCLLLRQLLGLPGPSC